MGELTNEERETLLAALTHYRDKKVKEREAMAFAQYYTHELKLRAEATLNAELGRVDDLLQKLT